MEAKERSRGGIQAAAGWVGSIGAVWAAGPGVVGVIVVVVVGAVESVYSAMQKQSTRTLVKNPWADLKQCSKGHVPDGSCPSCVPFRRGFGS